MVVYIFEFFRKYLDFLYGNDRSEFFLRFKYFGYVFFVLKIVIRNFLKYESEVVLLLGEFDY